MANEGQKGCKKARRSQGYYYSDARRAQNKRAKDAKNKKRVERIKARQDRLVKQGILVRIKKVDGSTKLVHKDKYWSEAQRFSRTVKALMHHIKVDENGRLVPFTSNTGHVLGDIHPGFRDRFAVSQDVVDAAVARKFAIVQRKVA